jgi:hypothetical protein
MAVIQNVRPIHGPSDNAERPARPSRKSCLARCVASSCRAVGLTRFDPRIAVTASGTPLVRWNRQVAEQAANNVRRQSLPTTVPPPRPPLPTAIIGRHVVSRTGRRPDRPDGLSPSVKKLSPDVKTRDAPFSHNGYST